MCKRTTTIMEGDNFQVNPLKTGIVAFMASSSSVFVVAFVIVCGYLLFRRARPYWARLTFPVWYFLYARTRLGYRYHLWCVSKKKGVLHSITQPLSLSDVTITPIAIAEDNYAYLVTDTVSNVAVVIDPSDPWSVKQMIDGQGVELMAVLTTHKHWDHSAGNESLKIDFPDLAIYGGARDNVPGCTHPLQDKDIVKIGRMSFEVIWTPGHTIGHVIYMLQNDPPCLFTGDHIFIGGNGRMFECGAETMLASIKTVAALPHNTLIFPGHEYTWLNLKFASHLLPTHRPIQNKLQWVKQQRARKLTTVPSILSEELKYNLFMRTGNGAVKDALGLPQHTSEANVLTELRQQKNSYKPFDT